jgi:hypothetical protein
VSKLREKAKTVIGVGVKNSTSDLLISNCDEFIFYDELMVGREASKRRQRGKPRAKKLRRSSTDGRKSEAPKPEDPAQEAINLVLETIEALYAERGDSTKLWGSMIKQTLKRRRPGFNESSYGFQSFSDLLEEAQSRNLLQLELDEKSGGYIIRKVADIA